MPGLSLLPVSSLSPHTHTALTHPVFVIHHVPQHVVQVQDASVSMLQPVDLHPVVKVLGKKTKHSVSSMIRSYTVLHVLQPKWTGWLLKNQLTCCGSWNCSALSPLDWRQNFKFPPKKIFIPEDSIFHNSSTQVSQTQGQRAFLYFFLRRTVQFSPRRPTSFPSN